MQDEVDEPCSKRKAAVDVQDEEMTPRDTSSFRIANYPLISSQYKPSATSGLRKNTIFFSLPSGVNELSPNAISIAENGLSVDIAFSYTSEFTTLYVDLMNHEGLNVESVTIQSAMQAYLDHGSGGVLTIDLPFPVLKKYQLLRVHKSLGLNYILTLEGIQRREVITDVSLK